MNTPLSQNDIFQYPTPQSGDYLGSPITLAEKEPSQFVVDQQFWEIADREFAESVAATPQDLEMSPEGYEDRTVPEVVLETTDPLIVELQQIARNLQEQREKHLNVLVERAAKMGLIERTHIRLTAKDPSAILHPTVGTIINQESKLGMDLYLYDPEVTNIDYFLHEDEWFHEQSSSVPTKHFTNKYEIKNDIIYKSSTFYNLLKLQIETRTVIVDRDEAQTLLVVAKKYYEKVTGSVFVVSPAPRFQFGFKKRSA